MEGNEGAGFSISRTYSTVQEKIDVVQQVVTLLEETYGAAKEVHAQDREQKLARISRLQQQIQSLREEIDTDEESLATVTKSLEDGTKKYLGLENKLLTLEERSDDDFVLLPELEARTDVHVAQYLTDKYPEWQRLKSLCQHLNQRTQNSFRDAICVRRFQVCVTPTPEEELRFLQAAEKARALNAIRGKKCISGTPLNPSRTVCVTWYKNDPLATNYVRTNVEYIIEHVCKEHYEEYRGREMDVDEMESTNDLEPTSTANELTIHVQPDSSSSRALSAHNMPRRITLFQFNADMAVNSVPNMVEYVPTTPAVLPTTPVASNENNVDLTESPPKSVSPKKYVPKPKSKKTEQDHIMQRTIRGVDVLSLVGFDEYEPPAVDVKPVAPRSPARSMTLRTPGKSPYRGQLTPIVPPKPINSLKKEISGVTISESTYNFLHLQKVVDFSETQKKVIQAFKRDGDVDFRGVENSGKTVATLCGVHDAIHIYNECVQALIITPSPKATQWVLTRLEFSEEVQCCSIEQVMRGSGSKRNVNTPISSHILVGTLSEAKEFLERCPAELKSGLRFLILDRCCERGLGGGTKTNDCFSTLNKILYILDATIKVVVIRRINEVYPGLDEFCSKKLRFKHTFLDDHVVPICRGRSLSNTSASNNSSPTASVTNVPTSESASVPCKAGRSDRAQRNRRSRKSRSSVGSSKMPESPPFEGEFDDPDMEHMFGDDGAIVASREGLILFGICKNAAKRSTDPCVQEEVDENVAHMYALLGDEETNKIDCISMLNIEEDKCIIFCGSPDDAEALSVRLRQKKLWPQVLHEDSTNKDQKMILDNFHLGHVRLLICTDFLSTVSLASANIVMNYSLPKTVAEYMSRAAFAVRHTIKDSTERSIVVNLVCSSKKKELKDLKQIASKIGITLCNCEDA